jgi:hypothetical protein
MGQSGRQLVLEKYDWKLIAQKLNQAYADLLVNKKSHANQ